jgi:hypothetical protein
VKSKVMIPSKQDPQVYTTEELRSRWVPSGLYMEYPDKDPSDCCIVLVPYRAIASDNIVHVGSNSTGMTVGIDCQWVRCPAGTRVELEQQD